MVYKEMPKTNTKTETTTNSGQQFRQTIAGPGEEEEIVKLDGFCLLSRGINNKRKRIKNVTKRTVLLRIRTTDRQSVRQSVRRAGRDAGREADSRWCPFNIDGVPHQSSSVVCLAQAKFLALSISFN